MKIPQPQKPEQKSIRLGTQTYVVGKDLLPSDGLSSKDLMRELKRAGKKKLFPVLNWNV